MDYLKVTFEKLSIDVLSDLALMNTSNDVSISICATRDNFEGKQLFGLEFMSYEIMALKTMKRICDYIREEWPTVHNIVFYHRANNVPFKEMSVVIVVSSPNHAETVAAVSFCITELKATVPMWQKVYAETDESAKIEFTLPLLQSSSTPPQALDVDIDMVQINVPKEELEKRIQNFINRKREQVNMSNVIDFIPGGKGLRKDSQDTETCARVQAKLVKRKDSKGHLKISRVQNNWGPQTAQTFAAGPSSQQSHETLPSGVTERLRPLEKFLGLKPQSPEIYSRLKAVEDRVTVLETISPEYSQFWKPHQPTVARPSEIKYGVDDINKAIERLQKTSN